ncbi:MAG TPA: NAD(P)H-hydrate dehydratase [Acidimicrobiia bacterium]
MKPVLTADEYRRVDKAYSGDLDVAMDRAGYAVALAATRIGVGYGTRVSVLAGTGNNGGDGYVAARYLHGRGAAVTVHTLGPPKTEVALRAREAAVAVGVRIAAMGKPDDAEILVDAVFGGGVRDGIPAQLVPWMDASLPVVSVDFPSGLDPNSGSIDGPVFKASETVTFSTLKTGHVLGSGPDVCGRVTVSDIGINGGEPCMYVAEEEDTALPPRSRRSHKWSTGSVLVVGGSSGLEGAAVIAAEAALSFGAGSVAIASPNQSGVVSNSVEFPTFTFERVVEHLSRFDVVVFGPGLGAEDLAAGISLASTASRLVVDAGGLQPDIVGVLQAGKVEFILTPHSGEFERISGGSGGTFAVRALANKVGGVVLLKGNPTRISDGGLPILVATGGPELATIGTGDVLSGMIAAAWARGLPPVQSAVTGAYYHGIAARHLAARTTLTARELAREVGQYAW